MRQTVQQITVEKYRFLRPSFKPRVDYVDVIDCSICRVDVIDCVSRIIGQSTAKRRTASENW